MDGTHLCVGYASPSLVLTSFFFLTGQLDANLALPPLSLKRKNSSEWLRGSASSISVSTWP
nr:hypothetical protein Q903MT_gene1615 [Picea sitchensis]